jgi:hypothetical protein
VVHCFHDVFEWGFDIRRLRRLHDAVQLHTSHNGVETIYNWSLWCSFGSFGSAGSAGSAGSLVPVTHLDVACLHKKRLLFYWNGVRTFSKNLILAVCPLT